MKELIEYCCHMRSFCTDRSGLKVFTRSGLRTPQQQQSRCEALFGMIFNDVTIAYELLQYYWENWKGPAPPTLSNEEVELLRRENAERCISVTKHMLIAAMSNIEYSIRLIISDRHDHPLKDTVNRRDRLIGDFAIYFNQLPPECQSLMRGFRRIVKDVPPFDSFKPIIEKSHQLGYMSDTDRDRWMFIVEVRNCTVHNNCIPSQDRIFRVSNRLFVMKNGIMLNAELDFFTLLLLDCLPSLDSWLQSIVNPGFS